MQAEGRLIDNRGCIVTPRPGMADTRSENSNRHRRVLKALAALLLLNAALSFSTLWPTPFIVADARMAPEFVLLWVSLLALVAWGRSGPGVLAGVTVVYLTLVLGRYADVTVPSLFGRPINAYWDIPQIPRFLWVSAQERPLWQVAAGLVAVGLFLGALYGALRWAIGVAAGIAAPAALRRPWALLLSAALLAVAAANYAGVRATWPFVSKPVLPVAWRQAQVLAGAFLDSRQAALLPASSAVDQAQAAGPGEALAALRGMDVYLMPLESVGAVTYDDPEGQRQIEPVRRKFEQDLRAGGWQVMSAFLKAPTFAGGSDLSHLSLLSGIDLTDPMRHDVLLTTQRPTLVTLFKAHGYRTYGVYPGVFWEWPERRFYRFDEFIDGPSLGWRGPDLGYWKVPDQFAKARFEQLHPRDAGTAPRFVFFPTITNHLPFSPVPPFQPDWDRVLGDRPFDEAELQQALSEKPNWTNMRPDYWRMVAYTYQWLGSHLRRPPPRETLYIFVGDHQPAAGVTGEGASWDVPVHIVTRQERLLQRLYLLGYRPGMEPPRRPLGGLHDLTEHLLQVFSVQGPQPVEAVAKASAAVESQGAARSQRVASSRGAADVQGASGASVAAGRP